MANKTIRFITASDGRKPGDVETFEDTDADALIDGGLAVGGLYNVAGVVHVRVS
jgi:hypothetical protein